jgi:hypothetical protein
MNTLAFMAVANRLNASKPIESDGFRIIGLCAKLSIFGFKPLEFERFTTEGVQMRTLLADPNLKRLKS